MGGKRSTSFVLVSRDARLQGGEEVVMRKVLMAAVVLAAMSTLGCKKTVPNDIVQKTMRGVLTSHAPITTSGMCGVKVRGLSTAVITVKTKNADNTGVAHIRGTPWLGPGTPAFCEGDVGFKYTYSSKTTGYKRKTTTTTWQLEHVKLLAVQTPGVIFTPIDEDPDGEDDD
jgi:hypothetical protein